MQPLRIARYLAVITKSRLAVINEGIEVSSRIDMDWKMTARRNGCLKAYSRSIAVTLMDYSDNSTRNRNEGDEDAPFGEPPVARKRELRLFSFFSCNQPAIRLVCHDQPPGEIF